MGAVAKRSRDHARLVELALERAAAAIALAPAPVKAEPYAPIRFASLDARAAAEVEVYPWALGLSAPEPSAPWVAAVRAGLDDNLGWGPVVRRSVLLPNGQQQVLIGQLSAVRQAYPDRQTVEDWARVGVRLVPAHGGYIETAPGRFVVKAAYVPIEEAPRAVQVEAEVRGLAAEVRG